LCTHMMDTFKDYGDAPKYLESMDKCQERMEKVQKRYGVNSYRREAECLNAADTPYQMRQCFEKEGKFRSGPDV